MKAYKQNSRGSREIISSCVENAKNFSQKLCGLIFRRPLEGDEALLIENCKSIHTMGMGYDIDVIFTDRDGKIIAIYEDIAPWRFTPYINKAYTVLESKSGFVKEKSLAVGDRLVFE